MDEERNDNMEFCSSCGKEVSSEAVVCIGCGVALKRS